MAPRSRLALPLVAALLSTLVTIPLSPRAAAAPTLPPGFVLTDRSTGQSDYNLTDFALVPTGGVLSTGKTGEVMFAPDVGTPRLIAHPPTFSEWDLGMTAVALAPDYSQTGQIYLVRAAPLSDGGKEFRLSRWTVDDITAPSALSGERVILRAPGISDIHGMTDLAVEPDGTLWISIGDSALFSDPGSLRSLDLDQPYGKLLRIRPDGSGDLDNPFFSSAAPSSWRSRIYASGFRSPFRLSLDPASGMPILGDVGWAAWEEVDLVRPGENHGWPCWEGNVPTPYFRDLPECEGVPTATPLWVYPHGDPGGSVTGGVVYPGTAYPDLYRGDFFFGDYALQSLWTLHIGASGTLVQEPQNPPLMEDQGAPVALGTAPNGDIVYADIASGDLRRLSYQAGNRAPVASATFEVKPSTRTVTFDASASVDYDGDTLRFAWDFGDGARATGPVVSHQYPAPGTSSYQATVTVTDPLGASDDVTMKVVPSNWAPVVDATFPAPDTRFAVGDVVRVSATADDQEDGPLPVSWSVTLVHCATAGCHAHPGEVGTGPEFSVELPDHGSDTRMEIIASAIDSTGMRSTRTYVARPRLHALVVDSSQPADMTIGEAPATSAQVTAGATVSVVASAVAMDGVATFDRWENGATSRTRTLTMPDADLTLGAAYISPIDRRHRDDAAFRTALGSAVELEQGDASLRWRLFERGRGYWTAQHGVHPVQRPTYGTFLVNGAHGRFGVPVTDERATPDLLGRFTHFARRASIYWTSGTGARAVFGAIRSKWAALGWERSLLRYPTTSERSTPDGIGRFTHFQRGSVYWHPKTGAHEVHGAIRSTWASLGWERSYLGYPTSDEFAVPAGRRSNFQHGYMVWDKSTGRVTHRRY